MHPPCNMHPTILHAPTVPYALTILCYMHSSCNMHPHAPTEYRTHLPYYMHPLCLAVNCGRLTTKTLGWCTIVHMKWLHAVSLLWCAVRIRWLNEGRHGNAYCITHVYVIYWIASDWLWRGLGQRPGVAELEYCCHGYSRGCFPPSLWRCSRAVRNIL